MREGGDLNGGEPVAGVDRKTQRIAGVVSGSGKTCTTARQRSENSREAEPVTQLSRMCERLAVEMIAAGSPQAKAGAHRNHRAHQDRLRKRTSAENPSQTRGCEPSGADPRPPNLFTAAIFSGADRPSRSAAAEAKAKAADDPGRRRARQIWQQYSVWRATGPFAIHPEFLRQQQPRCRDTRVAHFKTGPKPHLYPAREGEAMRVARWKDRPQRPGTRLSVKRNSALAPPRGSMFWRWRALDVFCFGLRA